MSEIENNYYWVLEWQIDTGYYVILRNHKVSVKFYLNKLEGHISR